MKSASPAIKSIANAIVLGNQMSRRPTQDEVNGQIAAAEEQRYNEQIAQYDDWTDDELADAVEANELVDEDDDASNYSREALIRMLLADRRF